MKRENESGYTKKLEKRGRRRARNFERESRIIEEMKKKKERS